MAVAVALITFFSTGLGGLAAIGFRDRLHLVLGFASGAVIGVVLFDILPEVFSFEAVPPRITVATAVAFLAFFILERVTALHAGRDHERLPPGHKPEVGVLAALGFAIHSFLDGVAIGVAFQAGTALGIAVAVAVIAHDFNDGLNTVTVMLAHGNTVPRALPFLLLDMVAPVLGATSTLFVGIPGSALPWILAFFAGTFLYIGASDLLPAAREHDSPWVPLTTVIGMATLFLVTQALPK